MWQHARLTTENTLRTRLNGKEVVVRGVLMRFLTRLVAEWNVTLVFDAIEVVVQ